MDPGPNSGGALGSDLEIDWLVACKSSHQTYSLRTSSRPVLESLFNLIKGPTFSLYHIKETDGRGQQSATSKQEVSSRGTLV